jgi:DNA-binding NarL/FixJ family response regulator
MRVLIVDDSAIVRERLAALIGQWSWTIELIGQAQNALEARDAIWRLKPDLITLDIQMPGGSGIDVLKEIKKEASAPVVLILTNYPHPQYRKACLQAGADYFFDKSTEFDKVAEVLKELIHRFDFPILKNGEIASLSARND